MKGFKMSDHTVAVTDGSFSKDVLESNEPVLVDFWAEWCGPCRMVAPALDEIGAEYQGRLKVAKVNIDSNPETPTKYGVRSIPTFIVFKGGKPVAQQMGAMPKSQLKAWVDSAL
ncbi:thioredoxin TrxA [Swingsia samuiensis]|uniref:Thioredoxin n=2 Tax=Swingsia samuiensis TaxID=1293412 RepID=A0A4Y6UJU1_9PROT|nr:thioredoxin TrxA [Swingsia samuiensis]